MYDQAKAPSFFLVWSPTGHRPPTVKHTTQQGAELEATRLANEHPNSSFFVLATVCEMVKTTVHRINRLPDDLDNLPF